MFKLKLQVGNLPSNRLALTNKIYVSQENLTNIANFYAQHKVQPLANSQAYLVLLNAHPYAVEGHAGIPNDQVALNGLQRRFAKLSLATAITLAPLQPYPPPALATIEFAVDTLAKSKPPASASGAKPKPREIDSDRLAQTVLLVLEDQVLKVGQTMALDFEGTKLELSVTNVGTMADFKKQKKAEKAAACKTSEIFALLRLSTAETICFFTSSVEKRKKKRAQPPA
jgi:hypothetical protein